MEIINLLEVCSEGHATVKKSLNRFGITELSEGNQPFTDMTEKKVLVCLFHWITHTMKPNEEVNVRIKQGNETYEVEFKYTHRHLRTTKPIIVSDREDWVTHSWTDGDCFNTLTAESIQSSIERANQENRQQRTVSSNRLGIITIFVRRTSANNCPRNGTNTGVFKCQLTKSGLYVKQMYIGVYALK